MDKKLNHSIWVKSKILFYTLQIIFCIIVIKLFGFAT
jgi:hypothetical protein